MPGKISFLLGVTGWLLLQPSSEMLAVDSFPEPFLEKKDRVLILAPHPDDEVLGCGGVIQQALAGRLPVRIVFLTYGDHNEWSFMIYRVHPVLASESVRRMGMLRHDEALAAANILGLPLDQVTFLGYPDLGTMHIWSSHWGGQQPFHSRLTDATTVPYTNAFRPGASYRGEEVLRDLTRILKEFQPTKVFVSHPADHHPDHRALYLFLRVALWDIGEEMKPELFPYLIHFKSWPEPKGLRLTTPLEPPAPLRSQIQWKQDSLTFDIAERNHKALAAHHTQYRYSSRRLLALLRTNELFGDFSPFVFRSPANDTGIVRADLGPIQPSPEELTDEERAALLAVEECHVTLEKDALWVTIGHSRPLAERVGLSLFAFGYRPGRPFGEMPKLEIKINALKVEAYDGARRLSPQGVTIERGGRRTALRIPFVSMGNPDRVLMTIRTYIGDLPVDWTSWRVLELPRDSPRSR